MPSGLGVPARSFCILNAAYILAQPMLLGQTTGFKASLVSRRAWLYWVKEKVLEKVLVLPTFISWTVFLLNFASIRVLVFLVIYSL